RLGILSEVCALAQTSSEHRCLRNSVFTYVRSHSLPRRALRYPQGEAFRFFDFAQNDTEIRKSVKYRIPVDPEEVFYPLLVSRKADQ
ncbi:MAG: hypothetical protein IKI03_06085, partial [Clostridia bacterium]|nr:hypothetical protein [Clostridia bacterium]